MVQKYQFLLLPLDFCFQCTLAQYKIWKKQIDPAILSPCDGKIFAWWRYLKDYKVLCVLKTFITWSSFHKERAIRKSILVTNPDIAAWVVKHQIVMNQGIFVMLVLKIQHYVLNHISSWIMKLSKIEFMRSDLLQNVTKC